MSEQRSRGAEPRGDLEIAVLGDLHGAFDAELDAPLISRHPVRLCTGDLTPNRGRDRFDVAVRVAEELATLDVHVVLGNHDGPTCFTGRRFPKSYERLEAAFGELHVGGRRVELREHDLTLVGGRPLSQGGPDIRFRVPEREDWTFERWGEEIARLIREAECSRVLVLAHGGPTGLGARRDDIYGCDFQPDQGDWGDADLRRALDTVRGTDPPVVAVVAGHMHHALQGGGRRARSVREGDLLHVNAAIVPRVTRRGRAVVVLTLEASRASARVEWHRDGEVEVEEL